jgi:hypothetical protein
VDNLTPLFSTTALVMASQHGPMILRLSTKSSNALVFVPNIRAMLGEQAFIGTWGSVRIQ